MASRSFTGSSASRARVAVSIATSRRFPASSAASGWRSSPRPRACWQDTTQSRTASAAKSSARSGKEITMSRIGKKEIPVPKGVEIKKTGEGVSVKGPKGTLMTPLVEGIDVKIENNVVQFTRSNEEGKSKAFHGLMRA